MSTVNLIGSLAGTLTTIAFLPQVLRVWRTKRAEDLSLGMLLLFTVGIVLWLTYGILLAAWPIILPNVITLLLQAVILWLKLRYRATAAQPELSLER